VTDKRIRVATGKRLSVPTDKRFKEDAVPAGLQIWFDETSLEFDATPDLTAWRNKGLLGSSCDLDQFVNQGQTFKSGLNGMDALGLQVLTEGVWISNAAPVWLNDFLGHVFCVCDGNNSGTRYLMRDNDGNGGNDLGFNKSSGKWQFRVGSSGTTWGSAGTNWVLLHGRVWPYQTGDTYNYRQAWCSDGSSSTASLFGVGADYKAIGLGATRPDPPFATTAWAGSVAEIRIYDDTIDEAEGQAISAALADKWGLTPIVY